MSPTFDLELFPRAGSTVNNPANNARNTARGISVAVIVVIVVVVVVTLVGSALAIFCWMRHRRRQREIREKYGGGGVGGVGGFGFKAPAHAGDHHHHAQPPGMATGNPGFTGGTTGMGMSGTT